MVEIHTELTHPARLKTASGSKPISGKRARFQESHLTLRTRG
jgi:hypothetical protein